MWFFFPGLKIRLHMLAGLIILSLSETKRPDCKEKRVFVVSSLF